MRRIYEKLGALNTLKNEVVVTRCLLQQEVFDKMVEVGMDVPFTTVIMSSDEQLAGYILELEQFDAEEKQRVKNDAVYHEMKECRV